MSSPFARSDPRARPKCRLYKKFLPAWDSYDLCPARSRKRVVFVGIQARIGQRGLRGARRNPKLSVALSFLLYPSLRRQVAVPVEPRIPPPDRSSRRRGGSNSSSGSFGGSIGERFSEASSEVGPGPRNRGNGVREGEPGRPVSQRSRTLDVPSRKSKPGLASGKAWELMADPANTRDHRLNPK